MINFQLFWHKKGGFKNKTPLGGKREFFSKIRLEHFFSLAKKQLGAKFRKNLMRGSPDMLSHTHTHTRPAKAERPKIQNFKNSLSINKA